MCVGGTTTGGGTTGGGTTGGRAFGWIDAEALGVPLGSGVVWDSVAVLVIVPVDAFTVTVMDAVGAVPPTGRVPIVQVTVSTVPTRASVIVPVEVDELT